MMASSTREIFDKKAKIHVQIMTNLAETITASSIKNVQEFPFVRVPKFELLGSHVRSIDPNDVIIWAPLVAEQQREQWSNFSASENGWYNESVTIYQSENDIPTDLYENGEFRDDIWEGPDLNDTSYMSAAAPGPFAPLWHISPPTLSLTSINYNLLHVEHIRGLFSASIQANDFVMGEAKLDTEGLPKTIVTSLDLWKENHHPHPHTVQVTPVFENLSNDSSIVGFILSSIDWEEFLAGAFTSDINGVVVVIRNNCNQSLSFEISHGEVRYT